MAARLSRDETRRCDFSDYAARFVRLVSFFFVFRFVSLRCDRLCRGGFVQCLFVTCFARKVSTRSFVSLLVTAARLLSCRETPVVICERRRQDG